MNTSSRYDSIQEAVDFIDSIEQYDTLEQNKKTLFNNLNKFNTIKRSEQLLEYDTPLIDIILNTHNYTDNIQPIIDNNSSREYIEDDTDSELTNTECSENNEAIYHEAIDHEYNTDDGYFSDNEDYGTYVGVYDYEYENKKKCIIL